jgi:hypothetical protein
MSRASRWLGAGAVGGAVALAGCGGSDSPRQPDRELSTGGARVLHLPVRAAALFEAGDLDRDGTDDLVLAAGRDHQLFAWTSRRRALTRLTGAKFTDSESGSYPVGATGGIVLTGARLSWVAARRAWPAAVRPAILDRSLYRPQAAAADGDVLVVDARGQARIVRVGGTPRVPLVRTTQLRADGAVGAQLREFAFTRGRENWLLPRAGSPSRLADSASNEFTQLIAPFGDRALTVVLRETDGLPDQQRTQHLSARLVDKRSTTDSRPLDGDTVDSASRSTRHGLAVIDRKNHRVTLLDVSDGRLRARTIPDCVGIADKDDGVAILRPNGNVELLRVP